MASIGMKSWLCRFAGALAIAFAEVAAAAEPKVVVTLKPVHSLVAAVMAGGGAPELLIEGGASPHTFAMKPSDARRLAAADLVVRVADGLETFLVKSLAGLPKRVRIATLEGVPGLTLHGLRAGAGFGAHDHGTGKNGHGHGVEVRGSKGQVRTATDSHLWLDPANARLIVLHMGEVLADLAPELAGLYRQNAIDVAARLEALDQRLAADLKIAAGRPFLVFHDAYQYFERRYGLVSAGSVTVSPEVPPSAQRLSRIRALLAAKGAVCVFAEPQFPPRTIDTILDGTSVRRGTLDPLGAGLEPGAGLYEQLLTGLARDLKGCLAAPS